jgi:hypothetical protein
VLRTTLESMQERRSSVQSRFTCKHCHKLFVMEGRFLQHQCKQMKREEEFKTPIGQTAWYYYTLWMRNMKRLPPPAGSFLTSKYFRTFINFVKFTKKVELPRVDKFIWLMVQKEYQPTIWMNDEVYAIFLEFLDRQTSGIDNATLSIQTLIAYCDKHEIELGEVFTHIPIQEIIHLLHVRKLSPWLLLFSKTFKSAYVNRTSPEQKIILENLIRPEYWPDKMAEFPEQVAKIKMLVAEMGI